VVRTSTFAKIAADECESTLAAIAAAVPPRLLERDLLFVVERLVALLDENRLVVVARQHAIKKTKDSDSFPKLLLPIYVVRKKASWDVCWLS
jgi:hypothetical protein